MNARLYYRAIKLNIKMYKWDRALEIATQNRTHIDTVIAYRQRWLQQHGKQESNDRFLQMGKEIAIDWDTIKNKIR